MVLAAFADQKYKKHLCGGERQESVMGPRDNLTGIYKTLEGGLFSSVTKADVGTAITGLASRGCALMCWADPFFPDHVMPKHIEEAVVQCIREGMGPHYTMPIGDGKLKELIAARLKRDHLIEVSPERNIVITPGSDSGLLFAMTPFIGQGDEVLVHSPSYPSNFLNPDLLGGKCVPVPTREENNYQLEIEEYRRRLTNRTKMVILTQPNNPTTTVYRRECLEQLAQFVIENNLILVVDYAFEDMIYDGIELFDISRIEGMWERTLSVHSISKGMALSGLRVGYVVADDRIMDVMYGYTVNIIGATNTSAQQGAIAAFSEPSFVDEYKKIFEKRRRTAFELFNSIPGVSMRLPESSYLSWVDVSKLGTSAEVSKYILDNAQVLVNEGPPYGPGSEGYLRIVHGCYRDEEVAASAMRRIRDALLKLSSEKL